MQLPAYLKKRGNADALLAGLGGSQPPTINRRNNRFTLIDAAGNQKPVNTLTLDVVIIDQNEHVSKTFYEGEYDPNEVSAPDCFSDNGVAPSVNAAKPQNPVCATCPQAAWGSGGISRVSGKQTKACQDSKKLACLVVQEGFDQPIVYMLQVPPGSFKHLRQYGQSLAGHGCEPHHVVTRIAFDAAPGVPNGILTFQAVAIVTEQQNATAEKLLDDKATDAVVGRLDKPRTQALPAPVQPAAATGVLTGAHPGLAQQPPADEPFFKPIAPALQPVQKTKEEIEREEFERWKASKAAAPATEEPKRTRGRPKAEKTETVVGPGPMPQGIFPTQQPAPQAQSPQFGMVANPLPPDSTIESMLANIASLPT